MGKKIAIIIKKQWGWTMFIFVLSVLIVQSCSYEAASDFNSLSGEGSGGSMARFTIANNHLYTVDESSLKVFDVGNAETPVYKKNKYIGFGVETIFPFGDKLFMGTSTGMYIYSINNPEQPEKITFYEHVFSCDPVVSDGEFAYVTLNSTNQMCWRSVNELQVLDLQNIQSPKLVKQYPMDGPRGLAVRNDTLWVCDNGIKIYDVKNKQTISELYHFSDLVAYDVILNKDLAMVIGESGFVQYKLENGTIRRLSEISVEY